MMMMSSVSSSAAAVAVDKATSDLLIGPDWTMNIDICDSVNSNHWQAKDVVKAVKRRLQHKSSKVQLLALTLLETMVKNCGDYVHFQIAERNVLGEMVKIVRKKADMLVRDKILTLLDSWQEAFGGPGGKHPQYYWAYDELRRSGVEFPKRSSNAAPIFTPPATVPTMNPGYGMPSNSSRRLDETMATEIESLSLSSLDSMRDVMELLTDMLQAVNPGDCAAVKDEVIVDLVTRCRSNQKKLMQMLTTTGDEELLARGLELNDSMQSLLAKHDAIAVGSPLPVEAADASPKPTEASSSNKSNEVKSPASNISPPNISPPNISPPGPVPILTRSHIDEEEEEEDDFAQLARRHSRATFPSSQSASAGTSGAIVPISNATAATSSVLTASTSIPSNALALPDPPARVWSSKEQDLIDLLSLTLSTTSASMSHSPPMPSSSHQNLHQGPVTPNSLGYPYASQTYPGSQGPAAYNGYVVPWAQPQFQPQYHSQQNVQASPQTDPQSQSQTQFQGVLQTQNQSSSPPQFQPQSLSQSQSPHQARQQTHDQPPSRSPTQNQPYGQPQYRPYFQPQYGYPPPPWAATPGYFSGQNHHSSANGIARVTNGGAPMNGDAWMSTGPRNAAPATGQKPFIPSYRLFEDLNVLDGRHKMTTSSSASPNLSGNNTQSMVGGRK
ncbi:TOM1-like protein 6 isoform X2 [Hibiscus syriacus]|uniref:TOM1-like protein 6 isoform X2 n=1 Tax=Hibiscus syriacus TaxID=106335 RepID=UPI001924E13B|nr:TOM1-like protein 6 isoform X2 [Hibiscus syriacus]